MNAYDRKFKFALFINSNSLQFENWCGTLGGRVRLALDFSIRAKGENYEKNPGGMN